MDSRCVCGNAVVPTPGGTPAEDSGWPRQSLYPESEARVRLWIPSVGQGPALKEVCENLKYQWG